MKGKLFQLMAPCTLEKRCTWGLRTEDWSRTVTYRCWWSTWEPVTWEVLWIWFRQAFCLDLADDPPQRVSKCLSFNGFLLFTVLRGTSGAASRRKERVWWPSDSHCGTQAPAIPVLAFSILQCHLWTSAPVISNISQPRIRMRFSLRLCWVAGFWPIRRSSGTCWIHLLILRPRPSQRYFFRLVAIDHF